MARTFDRGDHRDYHHGEMRSVGIKALKAHLSRNIDLVRKGEVLVTDRDEVVAEIRLPSQLVPSKVSRWELAMQEEVRRGSVIPAKRTESRLRGPPTPCDDGVDVQKILAEIREDRFR